MKPTKTLRITIRVRLIRGFKMWRTWSQTRTWRALLNDGQDGPESTTGAAIVFQPGDRLQEGAISIDTSFCMSWGAESLKVGGCSFAHGLWQFMTLACSTSLWLCAPQVPRSPTFHPPMMGTSVQADLSDLVSAVIPTGSSAMSMSHISKLNTCVSGC